MLSEKELLRYSRQLPLLGKEGQEALKKSRVLVVGLGGLGSPAALYLASAGVGTLGLCDFDQVQEHNLHRQLLFTEKDLGTPKTLAAKETLEKLNPFVKLELLPEKLTEENSEKILKQYDIIMDCTDSLETKFLLNRTCRTLGKPLVYGAAVGTEGQLAVFTPEGPCLACLVKTRKAPTCSSEGVLPTIPGVIGCLQAGEALKLALKQSPLDGLLVFDGKKCEFKKFSFSKSPDCPACSGNPQQKPKPSENEITTQELKSILKTVQLIDVREQREWDSGHIPGAVHIPIKNLPEKLKSLDKRNLIVTYCQIGNRSLEAQKLLAKKGFQARTLKGGLEKWQEICPGT